MVAAEQSASSKRPSNGDHPASPDAAHESQSGAWDSAARLSQSDAASRPAPADCPAAPSRASQDSELAATPARTYALPKGKGYLRWLPGVLRAVGIAVLLLSVVALLPSVAPRLAGMETYAIQTASMTPSLPVGTLVLVQPKDVADIPVGEVVAYRRGESVIVHRVTTNQVVEGYLKTKGDANDLEDQEPVPYADVIGQVTYSVPGLGAFAEAFTTVMGKVYFALFIIAGLLMVVLAGQLTSKRRYFESGMGE